MVGLIDGEGELLFRRVHVGEVSRAAQACRFELAIDRDRFSRCGAAAFAFELRVVLRQFSLHRMCRSLRHTSSGMGLRNREACPQILRRWKPFAVHECANHLPVGGNFGEGREDRPAGEAGVGVSIARVDPRAEHPVAGRRRSQGGPREKRTRPGLPARLSRVWKTPASDPSGLAGASVSIGIMTTPCLYRAIMSRQPHQRLDQIGSVRSTRKPLVRVPIQAESSRSRDAPRIQSLIEVLLGEDVPALPNSKYHSRADLRIRRKRSIGYDQTPRRIN